MALSALVGAGKECEPARPHAEAVEAAVSDAVAAAPCKQQERLCTAAQSPALAALAEALLAEWAQPEEQLALARAAATRPACASLLCANLAAGKKVGQECSGQLVLRGKQLMCS